MKKIFIFCITLFLSFSTFAENEYSKNSNKESLLSFAIEPCFGTRIGFFGEQVYEKDPTTNEEYKLSELIYNFMPAFYAGFDSDSKISNFHFTFGCKFFLPLKTGTMQDSDWLQNAGNNRGDNSVKTNYSEHENKLHRGFNLEAAIKYDFHPAQWLVLSPVISFLYEEFTMSALNGTCWYGKPLNDGRYSYYSYDDINNREIISCNGKIVQLRRKDYYAWIGLESLFIPVNSSWNVFCGIYAAPFIYTYGEDDHYKRNYFYVDITASVFFAGKLKIYARYNFSDNCSFKISSSFLFTGKMKGTEKYKRSETGPFVNKSGSIGATSIYTDIQLSAELKY